MINRLILLDKNSNETFFLWGPRQSGKSTLLKKTYPDSIWVDLLKSEEFVKYSSFPERLREELIAANPNKIVVIDEIQKVPRLLDEVQWLIENKKFGFALCGSSARKLKRGHANLLGGRAIRFELFGFCSRELGADFDLLHTLNFGYIPSHYLSSNPARKIRSYITDYLKEEIKPYMEMELPQLIALMPDRRPFEFNPGNPTVHTDVVLDIIVGPRCRPFSIDGMDN